MGFDINCLKPGMVLIKINVENNHTIEKVSKVVGQNCTLIYNQVELLPSKTVGFYNMTPGCLVVAVNNSNQKQINYWKSLSPNNAFMSRITGTHVLSVEKEAVRLRDIRMDKMELRSKTFARKLCSAQPEDFFRINKSKSLPYKYEKPKSICSDPLPIFWDSNSTINNGQLGTNNRMNTSTYQPSQSQSEITESTI